MPRKEQRSLPKGKKESSPPFLPFRIPHLPSLYPWYHRFNHDGHLIIIGTTPPSKCIKVTVGRKPRTKTFAVPPKVLTKAPTLYKTWDEDTKNPVYFEEEDPENFEMLLHYLNNRGVTEMTNKDSSWGQFRKIIDLYILASKYEVINLMEDIVRRLYNFPEIPSDPVWFFHLAQKVLNGSNNTSVAGFRTYFRSKADVAINNATSKEQDRFIENLMTDGGLFAQEMHDIYRTVIVSKVYKSGRLKRKQGTKNGREQDTQLPRNLLAGKVPNAPSKDQLSKSQSGRDGKRVKRDTDSVVNNNETTDMVLKWQQEAEGSDMVDLTIEV